jgi:hypothetical protein
MEPIAGQPTDPLSGVRLDLLKKAVELYLAIAYADAPIPPLVQRRLAWPETAATHELFTRPPFERAGKLPGEGGTIYALRLGNHRYPHMKLQIQPWPNAAGFMLSVNTHDQVAGLDVGSADAEAFRELQEENQRLKERIERAWEENGLPTFLNYLRDYIQRRSSELDQPESDYPGDPGILERPASS